MLILCSNFGVAFLPTTKRRCTQRTARKTGISSSLEDFGAKPTRLVLFPATTTIAAPSGIRWKRFVSSMCWWQVGTRPVLLFHRISISLYQTEIKLSYIHDSGPVVVDGDELAIKCEAHGASAAITWTPSLNGTDQTEITGGIVLCCISLRNCLM